MDADTYVAVGLTIGVLISIAIILYRNRKTPHPPLSLEEQTPASLEEQIAYQIAIIDRLIKQDPRLENFILEAKKDGATHVAYDNKGDGFDFYRIREGTYELRPLLFTPGTPVWNNWRNCNELPQYAVQIPDKFS